MAAETLSFATIPANGFIPGHGRRFRQVHDTSAPDTEMLVESSPDGIHKLTKVVIRYSAAVTLNATITLKSALGAAFDAVIETVAFNNKTTGFSVPVGEILAMNGDYFLVTAPAGGGVVTASVLLETEALGG